MPTHWSERDRKLEKRRGAMRVSGRGLKTVIVPAIEKRSREAERAKKYVDGARSPR